MKIFSTEESRPIAKEICDILNVELSQVEKEKFSDGEFAISLKNTVRGDKVFIVGSSHQSKSNDNFMELLMMIRAAKDSNAKEVVVINPYYGFARQDRKVKDRTCITAKLNADLIKTSGATSIVTVDIHARQIQGFFDFPSDNIDGYRMLLPYLKETLTDNTIICSPDQGGYVRASIFAKELDNLKMVVINKRRERPNEIASMELVGNVEGKDVVIIDDMIDTAGTLCKAVSYLKEEGAKSVRAIITHPVLSGNAFNNLNESELDELIVSNTIPKSEDIEESLHGIKVTVISCAPEMAKVIHAINENKSITHH
jgi:ribose-phosphate pyrophosphokinase